MSDNHHPGDPSVVGDELNGENHETTSETPYTSYQHLHQESNQAQEESEQQTVENGGFYWEFANVGLIREHSRDGSIHATDEVFNSASHLAACFISVLGTVLLVVESSRQGNPWKIVSFSIYGASLINMFGSSTLHHAITTTPKWESRFQLLDYLAIFPLIAGTFTPLCLVPFHHNTVGWSFCGTIWGLSILSMIAVTYNWNHRPGGLPKWFTMTLYITLGWLGAFFTYWLVDVLGFGGMSLMILGGVVYTAGGYIYTTEQPNPYPGVFG